VETDDRQPRVARRLTVLVIDDEPAVGTSIARVLGDHDVTPIVSARAALALLEGGTSFDVVLSDVMMPEMSGMELHAALARTRPDVAARMVFMTGGAFTATARAFLERIPNERIEKPFGAAALRELVERVATGRSR
jgi:CheY-like chemotaxis protein